jgi:ribonuclease J
MARITCWDGVGCIGGNKILLEDGESRLWLDFGLDFGRMGRFYEEFVKPKNSMGLYEPIQMGLLPPITDLYRDDLFSPISDPWDGIEGRKVGHVDGVLLSHAHVDHIGALSYLRRDIPVYSSAMTAAIAKATQDTSPSSIANHYCYMVPYLATETGELESPHFRKNPSLGRGYVLVDDSVDAEFRDFWEDTPSSLTEKGRAHEPIPLRSETSCGGLRVKRFPVDHSIYGASSWAIETAAGWVVYTGDVRCHGYHGDLTWKFAEEAAKLKPIALIIEGTRISAETTNTEDDVRDLALDEVRKADGLVVADFGPRNVERLISFLDIAKSTGRKLLILPKDAYLLEKMALAGDDVPSPDDESIAIYCKYEVGSVNWRKMLKESYFSKLVQPGEVAKNQREMICSFSFFDVNELAYIKPRPGSIWIYSSCESFNEEMAIDARRLGEWVDAYGMRFPGDPRQEESKNPYHVSGHACRTDLLKLIDIIDPKLVIPVHTEHPDLYAELLAGKHEVRLPERGVPIEV